MKEYTSIPLYKKHMYAVQVQVCYTSKVAGPKAHNITYVNSSPQTQGECETNLKLLTKVRRRPLGCDLVKISAS